PVAEITAAEWANAAPFLRDNPNASRTFLVDGHAPAVGSVFRNADLASTYSAIARGGAEEFYRGAAAAAIIRVIDAYGGAMRAADLADFAAEWVDPIQTTYRDW